MDQAFMASFLRERARWGIARRMLPSPVQARHHEYSLLYSADDAFSSISDRLWEISIAAVRQAREINLDPICQRLRGRFDYTDDLPNVWPGEHYRLLAGLVMKIKPKLIIEIGSAEGMSALTMLQHLSMDGQIITFDLIPWDRYPRSCLQRGDFSDGRLSQIIADLGDPAVYMTYRDLISQAEMIFIDAAKDGYLESRLIAHFSKTDFRLRPIFVFDDIRVWNMLAIWHDLNWPKIDLTSFGHWTGTGICELPN